MDKKTKTIIVVGVIAVGAYLLYRKARTKGDTFLNKPEADAIEGVAQDKTS